MQLAYTHISVEEYLKFEEISEIRHEYLAGEIFAMSGSSEEHNQIAGNIYVRLINHLRGSGCKTFISDMKVKITIADQRADLFYYPDLMVTCDSQDTEKYYKTAPCLIVEVLSPSTANLDKREKRLNYQTLPSLQEYVLVSQDQAIVEIYQQNRAGVWYSEVLQGGDQLNLQSVNLTIAIADIYEDVLML
jgi:Uma2 family endonuclease